MKRFKITVLAVLVLAIALLSVSCKDASANKAGEAENSINDTTEDSPSTTDPDEPQDEKYLKAKASIIELDEETKKEIEHIAFDIPWLDYELLRDRKVSDFRCYGDFDGCLVIFIGSTGALRKTIVIADYEFSHNYTFEIFGYCNNTLYKLEEAYEKGYISEENIAIAAERHRNVESYRAYCEQLIKDKYADLYSGTSAAAP